MIRQLSIRTNSQTEFIDITGKIQEIVGSSQISEGICCIYVPHTTAGITINENADPDVVKDIIKELNKIVPLTDSYLHREGNSAAHIKAGLMGTSLHVIVDQGRLLLGTWQGIYFCEFDGPRNRKVVVKMIEG
ncbi:secondary thiamine-phosphate synthase enzyme YjbQ [Candidatus Formimonas warabiya]|uniref:YjbQ family protein n=1 Tax=Formimonas warabiya TaxID=1761012 RepID=A0A3G1L0J8_FORW1|nr:secondary thiamine-phosphate synthase enzyme YjbQ [Candidatus Formimonas warabiya]ATW28190.1 hypothetical protein DCMF_28600 [Candidatus Formimonas warabiya]